MEIPSGTRSERATARRELLGSAGAVASTALSGCLGQLLGGDAIELESLDVGGSPGGEVPVRRPGTASLVDFFATWCSPCVPQMDVLRTVRDRFDDDELHLVSITNERDREAVRAFWVEHDGTWPVLLDPDAEATQSYEVRVLPTLVLLDPDGDVAWRHQGLAGEDELREQVAATL